MEYTVTWAIDIDGENHLDAAIEALLLQRKRDHTATVFNVVDRVTGKEKEIDLHRDCPEFW